MKIGTMVQEGRTLLSFEIFPPVRDADIASVYATARELSRLRPDFISVTYGAGGGGNRNTVSTAAAVKKLCQVETLPHFTCVGASREAVRTTLEQMEEAGLENILALRGDPSPADRGPVRAYPYAVDLIREVKSGALCIGAAAHPEGHIGCHDPARDLDHLKEKVAAGVDFLISQVFFDNTAFYRFRRRAYARDIRCPLLAGIMPVLNKKQVNRLIYLCGASLPAAVIRLLVKYSHDPHSLRRAGIEYSVGQVADLLANGVQGIHLYTMNQAEIAEEILAQLPDFRLDRAGESCCYGV